ncbi:MAG: methyltransferase [Marinovum sp.]|nr:methyltransferase [Marinovum sp.]
MTVASSNTTADEFLGGKLLIKQPRNGYRAGIDPVLLAASVNAKAKQTVLELGCGVGVASLCLGYRVPDLHLTGLEIQPALAQLAMENAQYNNIQMDVVAGDLAVLPQGLKSCQFDHVIANPPYFDRLKTTPAGDPSRERSMGEQTPLTCWTSVAAKRTKPKGYVHFIFRSERLPELLHALPKELGSFRVLPLSARVGRASELLILRARKSGRAGFCLEAPIIMHKGKEHTKDGDSYTDLLRRVLRDGAKLD